MPWYSKIALAFGFNKSKDQMATDILGKLIMNKSVDLIEVKNLLNNQPVLIFGAGPSLKKDIQRIQEANILKYFVSMTIDGATTAYLEIIKNPPHIIVTDLDGRVNDQLRAHELGSIIVVHGHGDNIPKLLEHVPKLKKVLGTTQVEERQNVHNFGGFTDGDRGVYLSVKMNAKLIVLAGMDLGNEIGEYSKTVINSKPKKILKLRFCKELLEFLATTTKIGLYNLTHKGVTIKGFRKTSPNEILDIVNKKVI